MEENCSMNKAWLEIAESSNAEESMFDENDLALHISQLVSENMKPAYLRIAKAWRQLGLSEKLRKQRIDDIVNGNLSYNDQIAEEDEKSVKKMHDIKNTKERELQALADELGEKKYEIPLNLTLLASARMLYLKCGELKSLKDKRLEEWLLLKKNKNDLHIILGIENDDTNSHDIPYSVPHPEDILNLKHYVKTLEEKKRGKFNKFITLRKSVVGLFEQLEKEPANDFETELILGDVSEFILSSERLARIAEIFHVSQEEVEMNLKRRKQLMDKLECLWDILGICDTDKTLFKTCNNNAKPSTLKHIENEIGRLEQIKRENMGMFVQRMRPEIVALWDKCLVGPKRREYFALYFDDTDYNDELLEIHERELEKYRKHYEEIKTILMGVQKYNEMWERFLELERKASDPARLKNRGGALLKESNERQRLQKEIPKLENSLLAQSKKWSEAHNGEIVFFNDISIENYLKNKWSEYSQSKELEKKCRQMQKKVDAKKDLKDTKSAHRTTPGNPLRKTPVKNFHNNQGMISKSPNKRTPLSPINPQAETPKRCKGNVQVAQSSNKRMNMAPNFGNTPCLNSTFNLE